MNRRQCLTLIGTAPIWPALIEQDILNSRQECALLALFNTVKRYAIIKWSAINDVSIQQIIDVVSPKWPFQTLSELLHSLFDNNTIKGGYLLFYNYNDKIVTCWSDKPEGLSFELALEYAEKYDNNIRLS